MTIEKERKYIMNPKDAIELAMAWGAQASVPISMYHTYYDYAKKLYTEGSTCRITVEFSIPPEVKMTFKKWVGFEDERRISEEYTRESSIKDIVPMMPMPREFWDVSKIPSLHQMGSLAVQRYLFGLLEDSGCLDIILFPNGKVEYEVEFEEEEPHELFLKWCEDKEIEPTVCFQSKYQRLYDNMRTEDE